MRTHVEYEGDVYDSFTLEDVSMETVRELLMFCGSKVLLNPNEEQTQQFKDWYRHHVNKEKEYVTDVYDEKGHDNRYWRGGFAFMDVRKGETVFYIPDERPGEPPMLVKAGDLKVKHPKSVKIII